MTTLPINLGRGVSRRQRLAVALTCLLIVLTVALLVPAATASSGRFVASNCAPVASQATALFFNTRQANGLFDGRVGDMNCGGGQPLLPAHDGHRGVADVAGSLVLFETALGPARKAGYAEPGKGFGVQLQLLDRSAGVLRQLTTGRKGIIWAKLHPSGTKVAWSELEQTNWESGQPWNHFIGVWSLHVADIQGGQLVNERKWQHPTEPGFIETYGWVPGTDRIIFANDSGTRSGWGWWLGAQLWTIPDTLPAGNTRTRVSQPFGWENAYHEFANIRDGWVYTSIVRDAKDGGMDLWRMRLDGSARERVSWFGGGFPTWSWALWKTTYTQVAGFPPPRYIVVGGMAWNGTGWIAGVTGDPNATSIDAYEIIP